MSMSPGKSPKNAAAGGTGKTGSSDRKAVDESRRNVLRMVRNVSIGAVVLSAGGWVFAQDVQRTIELQDLSAVGNGIPTVVQVHDPHCPVCQALQKEMLKAAKHFDAGTLQFRVANIRTPEGKALADRHGVPHITLLMLDGDGELQDLLQGLRERDILRLEFDAHVARNVGARG